MRAVIAHRNRNRENIEKLNNHFSPGVSSVISLAGMNGSDILNQTAFSKAAKKTGYGVVKDNETVFKRGEVIIPTKAGREKSKCDADSSTDNDSENRITAEEIDELNQA